MARERPPCGPTLFVQVTHFRGIVFTELTEFNVTLMQVLPNGPLCFRFLSLDRSNHRWELKVRSKLGPFLELFPPVLFVLLPTIGHNQPLTFVLSGYFEEPRQTNVAF